MALIEVQSLCRVYRRGVNVVQALSDVSFKVPEGESCAIVGESGAGKSTLARILVGRERPSSGTVRVAGVDIVGADIAGLSSKQLKKYWSNVQLVGQDPKLTFNPRCTVFSLLAEVLRNFDCVPRCQTQEQAVLLLKTVGLDASFLSRYPHEMSGGELQRLALARALAPNPRVLVLDEPTSALDSVTQKHIIELLSDLKARLGVTFLMICHDLGLAQMFAGRIIVMKDGCVVEDVSSAALVNSSDEYVQSLLAAGKAIGL